MRIFRKDPSFFEGCLEERSSTPFGSMELEN
jgi:hypothetical protein